VEWHLVGSYPAIHMVTLMDAAGTRPTIRQPVGTHHDRTSDTGLRRRGPGWSIVPLEVRAIQNIVVPLDTFTMTIAVTRRMSRAGLSSPFHPPQPHRERRDRRGRHIEPAFSRPHTGEVMVHLRSERALPSCGRLQKKGLRCFGVQGSLVYPAISEIADRVRRGMARHGINHNVD
jgi:hypothetical protein